MPLDGGQEWHNFMRIHPTVTETFQSNSRSCPDAELKKCWCFLYDYFYKEDGFGCNIFYICCSATEDCFIYFVSAFLTLFPHDCSWSLLWGDVCWGCFRWHGFPKRYSVRWVSVSFWSNVWFPNWLPFGTNLLLLLYLCTIYFDCFSVILCLSLQHFLIVHYFQYIARVMNYVHGSFKVLYQNDWICLGDVH